ncbi:MAG: hypothetical protein AAB263_10850, partial [Planctomycetota bacterium]
LATGGTIAGAQADAPSAGSVESSQEGEPSLPKRTCDCFFKERNAHARMERADPLLEAVPDSVGLKVKARKCVRWT